MPTVTRGAGSGSNLWSDTTAWSTGLLPVDGETVDLNGYVVALDIATIPAAGNLAAIGSPAKTGQLTIDLSAAVFNSGCIINALTIMGGTIGATGFISTTGVTTNGLTINGNIVGGASNNGHGLYHNSTGPVTINGSVTAGTNGNARGVYNNSTGIITVGDASTSYNISGSNVTNGIGLQNQGTGSIIIYGSVFGGSGAGALGVFNASTGTLTITGNVSGGSGPNAYGIQNTGGGVVTLNSCNLINGTGGVAYVGKPPTWNIAANDNYVQWGSVKFGPEPLDHQLLAGVKCGDITGNRVDCPVAKAIESSGNYGDPAAPLVGTYHEADVTEVQKDVTFGAAHVLTGTYAPAGGVSPSNPSLLPLGVMEVVV